MKIKDILPENRPRERLGKYGPSALSEAELLAVVLGNGTRGENVIDMSHRLIAEYGLDKLSCLSQKEIQKIKGIGPAKAAQITALFEFNKRCSLAIQERTPVKTAYQAYEYAKHVIGGRRQECFLVMYLDTKSRITKHEITSIGTLNSTQTHARDVFRTAVKENVNAIIIAHNHPSGDPAPSREDREITKELAQAGRIMGIEILDHVITGSDGYYSFKEKGEMQGVFYSGPA